MPNLSSNTKSLITLIAFLLIIVSCKKDPCYIIYDPFGDTGGTGIVNGEQKTFEEVFINTNSDGTYNLRLQHQVWFANSFWAELDDINIGNIEINLFDTTDLVNIRPINTPKTGGTIWGTTTDGDVSTHCYDIFESDSLKSWAVFTFHDKSKEIIVGNLQGTFLISEYCADKFYPSDPDTIYLTNCHFRAQIRP